MLLVLRFVVESARDGREQGRAGPRLGQIRDGASALRLLAYMWLVVARDEDDRRRNSCFDKPGLQFESGKTREIYVHDQALGTLHAFRREQGFGGRERGSGVAGGAEQAFGGAPDARVVFDDRHLAP